ncbi:MAG: MBL fold metallo-hydrolase [Candidatus Micrarchaeia archaeon]
MTSLTFFGGVNEIGGNKILIEDRGTRVFLDFGQSFTLLDDFFVPEAYLKPRERFGLRDLLALGLMPSLPGLYSKKALSHSELKFSEPEFHGIFITHAHFDHVAHLEYLHPEIPIYLGECTKLILDSMQQTMAGVELYSEENKLETFRTGKEIRVDSISLKPFHVDHSVPGAYGYIVTTSEGTIAYTGDLRMHGPRADMTGEFLQKASESDVDALIIEGTRVQPEEKRKNHSEQVVLEESLRLARESKRFILAMRYPRDIDRFRTFYTVAKTTGRQLVISTKTAHLLHTLQRDPQLRLPDPLSDPNLLIHDRRLLRPGLWEEPFLQHAITSDFIRENQSKLIVELDFYALPELIDIRPVGGECIHSMSEPFEEDPLSQISDEVLDNWLNLFGLKKHQLHASGHASKSQIFEMIERIGPKKVFPIHTLNQGLFREANEKTVVVEKGKKYVL